MLLVDVGTLIVMDRWPLVSVEVHLLDVEGLVVAIVVDLAAGMLRRPGAKNPHLRRICPWGVRPPPHQLSR